MKINGYSSAAPRATYKQNTNNAQPSFGNVASRAFETLGKACDIEPNGSLTRTMFFLVATVFMLGGRFFESRSNDEKREVVTRDVPAVALSVAGAPLINKAVAYAVTKKSGVPILTMGNPNDPIISIGKDENGKPKFTLGKQGKVFSSSFASQKQIIDWYSGLENMDDALVNFSETVDRHGGKLDKVFKKLGMTDLLTAITDKKDNKDILNAIKEGKANGSDPTCSHGRRSDGQKTTKRAHGSATRARPSVESELQLRQLHRRRKQQVAAFGGTSHCGTSSPIHLQPVVHLWRIRCRQNASGKCHWRENQGAASRKTGAVCLRTPVPSAIHGLRAEKHGERLHQLLPDDRRAHHR